MAESGQGTLEQDRQGRPLRKSVESKYKMLAEQRAREVFQAAEQ